MPSLSTPTTTDEYLAELTEEKRSALEKLRKAIKAAAPRAEECISYGIPGFRQDGKLLVSYGAATKHCAFYPGSILREMKKDLAGYETEKGTIRFQPEKPLPAALVKTIVKLRIAQRREV
ncbi:MAG TPA: DUF1801 domain-containing protein [Chthoniobacterales bacterium]|jgi:uncharacterized protein YdhG (YjbR/CyaY superfamily)